MKEDFWVQDDHELPRQSTRITSARDRLFAFLSRGPVLATLTIAPAMILFILIIVVPIAWTIYAGMFEIPIFSPSWTFVGLDNYVEYLNSEEFHTSLWRSVIFAGGSTALQLVGGTALALVVNRQFKFASLARALAMLPYLIPTVFIAYIALWMGNTSWGIVNTVPQSLGLIEDPIPWYGDPDLAMFSAIIVNSWKFSIFVTIMVLARLQSIPEGYYEAAKVSGANSYQMFRDITLPNLKSVIFIVLLLRGVWMFNKFDIIWVLTQGGPLDATTTAPVFAYRLGFQESQLGAAAAVSTIMFVLLAGAALVYLYFFDPEQEVRVE